MAAATTLQWLHRRLDLGADQGDDPRQGSNREDSDGGGTLSSQGNKSSSLAKLGATFIPVSVMVAVCLIIFIVLRSRCTRVYAPRTIASLRTPELPSAALPSGWFNWIVPFFRVPDTFVLNHGSLDGFFFLRFLKVLRNICLAGCVIIWPVLFPLHITGGNNQTELERLTLGNVANKNKFYAHVLVAWVFFGFVIVMVIRECIYYVNLRQAYLSSPYYSQRLSSRTLLLTCVPSQYCDEARLRKLYGDSAKRIWVPRTAKALVNLVNEREQTAMRLEKAEVQLIKKANLARNKWLRSNLAEGSEASGTGRSLWLRFRRKRGDEKPKIDSPSMVMESPGVAREAVTVYITEGKNSSSGGEHPEPTVPDHDDAQEHQHEAKEDADYIHPYGLEPTLPDIRGSVAAKWIAVEDRPHHRPLGNFGRRVDTIRWTRSRLKDLNLEIFKLRRRVRRGDGDTLPAAFIEFDTQEAAQAAHQVVAHHRPLYMTTRLLGIRPDEVIWNSLRMTWWERIVRNTLVLAIVAAAIIFWSIPSAIIGLVSNIEFLAGLPFLTWLESLPKPILGFLQGFVPALALSMWMAVAPIMLRALAAQAGAPSIIVAELFTQNAYFAFQVVQVFLITTITSAASGALMDILKDPVSATDLLAQNLPRASNFYLSYILIQCLASGAFGMLHILDLIRHFLFPRISLLPRSRFNVWSRLRVIYWGGIFPVFANMGVIALCYACIAPLILIFAAGGIWFIRIIYKYNLLYVFDSTMDSRGLFYPRALLHLIIGLYMAQICLIGLFALKTAIGPVVLMVLFLIFTVLVHLTLSDAIAPLLQNLPQTLALEEEIQEEMAATQTDDAAPSNNGAAANYYDTEQSFGNGTDDETEEEDDPNEHIISGDRALEGSSTVRAALTDWLKAAAKSKAETEAQESGLTGIFSKLSLLSKDGQAPGFITRWLHPDDFVALRKTIPPELLNIEHFEAGKHSKYHPPELWTPKPVLWIPRDEARVSRQEVAHSRRVVPISDVGATLDERGRVVVNIDEGPLRNRRTF